MSTTLAADLADAEPNEAESATFEPERVALPKIPAITAPDLSELDARGVEIEGRLGGFVAAAEGLDVVSADCLAEGGELAYQGTENGSFFDLAEDGSGTFEAFQGDAIVNVTVEPDGSGTYSRVGGGIITIEVAADGSGMYTRVGGAGADEDDDGIVSLETDGNGSGRYSNTGGNDAITDIEIDADAGSGLYSRVGGGILNVEAFGDGGGAYSFDGVRIEMEADGSWVYDGGDDAIVDLIVNADGTGEYGRVGGGILNIVAEPDGAGGFLISYDGIDEPFTSDIGILDPRFVVLSGPLPEFVVAEGFPPLDTLAPLQPPCLTVLRLDADVLFDFDSDQLRQEADAVLDAVAEALIADGGDLEVHGHTDAIGRDSYNLDLSERRAASVVAALQERGVAAGIEARGFGESAPVAPNETDSGDDDPLGRQLNRRVEILLLD